MFNKYLDQLSKNEIDITFFDEFVGIKDYLGNIYLNDENVINYLNNMKSKQYKYLKTIKEFSHDIVYFETIDGIILQKVVFENDKIIKIAEEKECLDIERIMITISYNGSNYFGFQKQKDLKTVQGTLEEVISKIENKEVKVFGASRTDAGVHAICQVVHFDTKVKFTEDKWMYLLNHFLPKDIRVSDVKKVSNVFHSRYDVIKKEYRYYLSYDKINPFKTDFIAYTDKFDIDKFIEESKSFIGRHDFRSFGKGDKDDTTREIYNFDVIKHDDYFEIIIEGNGFLHNMIRLMIGTLVKIASNKIDLTIKEILESKDKNLTKFIADPQGLYLNKIYY